MGVAEFPTVSPANILTTVADTATGTYANWRPPNSNPSWVRSPGLSMNARSVPPELKSATTERLSVAVLRATTPPAPEQVESTAAGRKCSTLYELSVWIWVAPVGHPFPWAEKFKGITAVLFGLTGGPLPTELPVPASLVIISE